MANNVNYVRTSMMGTKYGKGLARDGFFADLERRLKRFVDSYVHSGGWTTTR